MTLVDRVAIVVEVHGAVCQEHDFGEIKALWSQSMSYIYVLLCTL